MSSLKAARPVRGFPMAKYWRTSKASQGKRQKILARYIIQANREKYEDGNLPLRQIALLSDGLAPLAEALAHLIQQLDLENGDTLSSVRCAMENAAALGATGNIDLKDFITELLDQSIPASAREAASAVHGQFSRLDLSSDPSLPASGGGNLSIYGPAPADFDPAYLRQSPSLASLGIWTLFLGEYYLKILGEKSLGHPLMQAIKATMDDLVARGIYPPAPAKA